jgi:hypothetical protein
MLVPPYQTTKWWSLPRYCITLLESVLVKLIALVYDQWAVTELHTIYEMIQKEFAKLHGYINQLILNTTNSCQHGSKFGRNDCHLKVVLKYLETVCSNAGYIQVTGIHFKV